MGTAISGKDGNVSLDATDVENILAWEMTWEVDSHAAAHSDSSGWEVQTTGIKRWSGTFEMEVDTGKLASAIDTLINAGTDSAVILTAGSGATYSGNVRITSFPVTVDVTGGTTVVATFPFVGNGSLTRTTV